MNWATLGVFLVLFSVVTVLGFFAGRWRRGDLDHIHEWGLGGRRFGTIVTWFLLGGDLYTAYTFIAVPALVFGAGAMGFFAVPYTVLVYALMLVFMPRLWSVARKHGYITAADFVQGRYGSPLLTLLVAMTGILAVMPYIALQLEGIQVVIAALGLEGRGIWSEAPLLIAFAILAAYTYTSGLRAPAMIAVVKDTLVYVTVLAAVVVIPVQLGGYAHIFDAVPAEKLLLPTPAAGGTGLYSAYASLAIGSAFTLLLYPQSVTGVLSASGRDAIRRNTVLLPAYSLLLGLIALLGYMAVAMGVDRMAEFAPFFKSYGPSFAVPALFLHAFPAWFAGVALAAIAIGALVPAAIMSIAAANLFTRNIYRQFLHADCSPRRESQVAKLVSLVVKAGALAFIVLLPQQYAIQFQLLGGIWIIQTLPAVLLGLLSRWFHPWALVAGWALGMVTGTWMAATQGFKSAVYPLHVLGTTVPAYAALYSVLLNLMLAALLTLLFLALGKKGEGDRTARMDYYLEGVRAGATADGEDVII